MQAARIYIPDLLLFRRRRLQMKITWAESRQLMDEIVSLLKERGCDLSGLSLDDYEDLDNLFDSRNNHRWNGCRQEWIKEQRGGINVSNLGGWKAML
jgi:hypothetical protein